MQLSGAPAKIVEPFAVNAAPSGGHGGKRTVPVPSQTGITPGAASYNDGFPPLTMTPIVGGGVVMSGLDMNGILNEATAIDNWASAGAGFQFDSVFAAAIGGYPKGSKVLNAAGTGYWLSTIDNNSNAPDSGGAGWLPDSSRAICSVYASTQQTLATGNSKVIFDTVEFDSFSQWDATNKRFKALWAGVYRLSGFIWMPAPAALQTLATMIYKNGTLAKQCFQFSQVTDQPLGYPFDAMVTLAIGDYLETYMSIPATAVLAGQPSGSSEAYVYGQFQFTGPGN